MRMRLTQPILRCLSMRRRRYNGRFHWMDFCHALEAQLHSFMSREGYELGTPRSMTPRGAPQSPRRLPALLRSDPTSPRGMVNSPRAPPASDGHDALKKTRMQRIHMLNGEVSHVATSNKQAGASACVRSPSHALTHAYAHTHVCGAPPTQIKRAPCNVARHASRSEPPCSRTPPPPATTLTRALFFAVRDYTCAAAAAKNPWLLAKAAREVPYNPYPEAAPGLSPRAPPPTLNHGP
jgi:hypothetical protein